MANLWWQGSEELGKHTARDWMCLTLSILCRCPTRSRSTARARVWTSSVFPVFLWRMHKDPCWVAYFLACLYLDLFPYGPTSLCCCLCLLFLNKKTLYYLNSRQLFKVCHAARRPGAFHKLEGQSSVLGAAFWWVHRNTLLSLQVSALKLTWP